jgi:hypothetical protein
MTNEEMLELIRKDRPEQVIHEVISYKKTDKLGWTYEVTVDMAQPFMETTVKHVKITLPYPLSDFLELVEISKRHEQNINKDETN